ncbi:hypothetical protein DCAR_0830423 [Daucus carota subsp. sativus]|uniref:Helicase C-terminal domain-containing protein n=1 Tax=Daucus carota subsp. sativus TaxID=79200 RepID=A0A175YJG2_DAUCS|nr:hypothetical protein DCAR_0830423 [Daucus carota subsp. sativus]
MRAADGPSIPFHHTTPPADLLVFLGVQVRDSLGFLDFLIIEFFQVAVKQKSLLSVWAADYRAEKSRKDAIVSKVDSSAMTAPLIKPKKEAPLKDTLVASRDAEEVIFIKAAQGKKAKKVFKLWKDSSARRTIISCIFGVDVDTVADYFYKKSNISVYKAHHNQPKPINVYKAHSKQSKPINKAAEDNFRQNGGVLVVTVDLLLRMDFGIPFELINYDLPISITEFKSLAKKASIVTTLIDKKSSALCLMKLEGEGYKVPAFMQAMIDQLIRETK